MPYIVEGYFKTIGGDAYGEAAAATEVVTAAFSCRKGDFYEQRTV